MSTKRHELTRRLKRSTLHAETISVRVHNGIKPCSAYFVGGYGRGLAIHVTPGTVWWKVTHIASGMSFPALNDYPEVDLRTAWLPHALMADVALLCAVAQVHFLMSTNIDWSQIQAEEVQEHCRGLMGQWEDFAFRTLEESIDLVADEAVRHLSAKPRACAEA